jgi:hypothetical protein
VHSQQRRAEHASVDAVTRQADRRGRSDVGQRVGAGHTHGRGQQQPIGQRATAADDDSSGSKVFIALAIPIPSTSAAAFDRFGSISVSTS